MVLTLLLCGCGAKEERQAGVSASDSKPKAGATTYELLEEYPEGQIPWDLPDSRLNSRVGLYPDENE